MLVNKLAYQVVNKSKPTVNYNTSNTFVYHLSNKDASVSNYYSGEILRLLILCRIFISSCQYTVHNQHSKPGNSGNHHSPWEKTEVTLHRVYSPSVTVMHYGIDCIYSIMSTMVLYTTTDSNTMHYKDIEGIFRYSRCVQMTVQVTSN